MKIYLLTHKREIKRLTNTGNIAVKHAGEIIERILWERVRPDDHLVNLLENNNALLLYPAANEDNVNINDFDNLVIIDGTWQEAQKMYNQSPYLKVAPKTALSVSHQSIFQLRRNQREGGLCTIECVIELLRLKGRHQLADQLTIQFNLFNQR